MDYKTQFPNPQQIRTNWQSLNGPWEFAFGSLPPEGPYAPAFCPGFFDKTIVVPFDYHTAASGLGDSVEYTNVWYRRTVTLTPGKAHLLHFQAVDFHCHLWINGIHVAEHKGGHTPFTVELPALGDGQCTLTLGVWDDTHCSQPLGKQSWKDHNFLCWYTKTIGIWQSCWVEEVGSLYIKDFQLTPDIDQATVALDLFTNRFADGAVHGEVTFGGQAVTRFTGAVRKGRCRLMVDVSSDDPNFRLHFWHPDSPNLYDMTLKLEENGEITDELQTYFGMRRIHAMGQTVLLNNQEFYQKLILDQGYFPQGGLTATPEELYDDVQKIKEMGFNGVRKHQKLEDHHFLYFCDLLGLVLWAEMPSSFAFSSVSVANTMAVLPDFVAKHYNHPSVIVYTLLNESWGLNEVFQDRRQQEFVNGMVHMTKALDSTRLVIGNDGWEHTTTDILTVHDYNSDPKTLTESYADTEKAANGSPSRTSARRCYSQGYQYDGVPFMISEMGGVALDTGTSPCNAWGYGDRTNDPATVLEKIKSLLTAVLELPDHCGFCYTQLSDVHQEINGLLDHNHQYKFPPEEIRQVLTAYHKLGFTFQ